MALTFQDKLKLEYPIPFSVTIWQGNGLDIEALESLDDLIEACVTELASDIMLSAYMQAQGMRTYMPEDTVTVNSVKLAQNYMFQGNRHLKFSYDKGMNVLYLNYYPATITYKRKLRVEDLENLEGDRLIYVKSYVLWKMAEKELQILRAVNMNVDNGQVDWSVLEKFRDTMHQRYLDLKPEILMYSSSW